MVVQVFLHFDSKEMDCLQHVSQKTLERIRKMVDVVIAGLEPILLQYILTAPLGPTPGIVACEGPWGQNNSPSLVTCTAAEVGFFPIEKKIRV